MRVLQFAKRALRVVGEILVEFPEKGFRQTYVTLRQKAYSKTESLVLSRATGMEEGVHSGIPVSIRSFSPSQRDEAARWLGADHGRHYFARGGHCYLAVCERERLVGYAWIFTDSPLLRRLGYQRDALYIGDVWVSPEHRGRAVAGTILNEILIDVDGTVSRCIAEIDPENTPSVRAFEKVGFEIDGRVRLIVGAGLFLSHEWLYRSRR